MSDKLLNERPLIVLPSLAKQLNSVDKAIILQQIHWLAQLPHCGEVHDGAKWVYGTYEHWIAEYFPFWSAASLRRHINRLEQDGWLVSAQIYLGRGDATKYYRVNYEMLKTPSAQNDQMGVQNDQMGARIERMGVQNDQTIRTKRSDHPHKVSASIYRTETTTENTTKRGDLVQDQPASQPAPLPPLRENQASTTAAAIVQDAPTPIIQAQPAPTGAPAPVTLPFQPTPQSLPSQQGVEELLRAATDRFAGVYHRNGEQARIDGVVKRAGVVGVDRPQFTALVDTYLKERGLERVANGSSGYAGRALADAQEFITDLITYDERFRKPTGIRVLFHSWTINNPNLRDPSPSQLLGHASQMLEGKVKTIVSFQNGQFVTREATGAGGPKPELTFKQFLLRRHGADALAVVMSMTGKSEAILRQEYQTHLGRPAPVPA